MARQTGRNEAFNHAGNVVAAVLAGVLGAYVAAKGVFYLTVALAGACIVAITFIRPGEIDNQLARGGDNEKTSGKPARLRELFGDRRLLWFIVAVTLFHFANAAMLPTIGQELAQGRPAAPMYMSACIVAAQLVMIPTALVAGRLAATWGRRPVFLIGFAVLPLRGLLYTLTDNQYWLVAIQSLDGIGAGIFGVVSVLVIADLTKGTGRFNLTQGALATAVGLGASLSNIAIGFIVSAAGFNVGFITLAVIALIAFIVFYCFVPETVVRGDETPPENRHEAPAAHPA